MADITVYGMDYLALARKYKDMADGTYAEVVYGGGGGGTATGVPTVINVKDATYGAVGNGVTDDATAIQAALTAAALTGGAVYLPAGTYIIGTGLTIGSNVKLYGTGRGSILKAKAASNITMLSLSTVNSFNVIVSNLTLDGNKTTQSSGTGISFTWTGNSVDSHTQTAATFENLFIYGQKNDGLALFNTTNGVTTRGVNVDVYWCDGIGFNIQSSDNVWVNCSTEKTGLQGWVIGPTGGSQHLTNCIGSDAGMITAASGHGFNLKSASTLTGCFAQDNTAHGFYLQGTGNLLTGCIADSNSFTNAAGGFAGFFIDTSTLNNHIIGCKSYDRFVAGARTQKYGYQVVGTADNVKISSSSQNNITAEVLNTSSGIDVVINNNDATTVGLAAEITRATGAESAEAVLRIAADALLAPLASPTLTGVPLSTTPAFGDATTKIATTLYARNAALAGTAVTDPTGAAGVLVANMPRYVGTGSTGAITTQAIYLTLCQVYPGLPINTVTLWSGTQAAVTPANQWVVLVDPATRNKLAISADLTTTPWAALAAQPFSIAGGSGTYTVPAGVYAIYVGQMINAATVPSQMGLSASNGTNMMQVAPILNGRSGSGFTNPASCPATLAAFTAGAGTPLVWLS